MGEDLRGDIALFIERKHLDGWLFDQAVLRKLKRLKVKTMLFRLLEQGRQQTTHGWVSLVRKGRLIVAEVEQWG